MIRRNTRQRKIVLDDVMANDGHFTADEIYARVQAQDPHISRGTVYRNLQLLSEEHQIRRIKMPNMSDYYENGKDDHDHLYCRSCGKLIDVGPIHDKADEIVEKMTGYKVIRHSFLFSGICPECQKKQG